MIIVRIATGMGNQMFMYAAGLATAQRLNTELLLETSSSPKKGRRGNMFNRDNRPYCLECFPNITEREANFKNLSSKSFWLAVWMYIHKKKMKSKRIFRRLLNKIIIKFGLTDMKIFNQDTWIEPNYNPEFEKLSDNTFLWGCWEAEKFFKNIPALVRKKFTFAPECFNPELLAQVQNCNSVALHIRRGDKVINMSKPIGTTEDYLKSAIEKIYELTNEPEFFVFSDDLEWCKKVLPQIRDTNWHFIENQTPPQDMALMTKCKHIITAPSTFSWWGAWLNDNPNKIIIAPKIERWGGAQEKNSDLLPDEWIKL